jgi:DNA invertase Pin-like site-specific DNA recombinase
MVLAQELLSQGLGVAEVAKETKLKRQTVYRIKKDPARQAAALAAWYPPS